MGAYQAILNSILRFANSFTMKYYIKIGVGLGLLLSLCYISVCAQKVTGRYKSNSQLVLSGYGGFIFNKMNVANNDVYPNPIHAPTTFTFDSKIALDFQRTTRYGLIYGFGVEIGKERQNFDLVYPSFDFLDTFSALSNFSFRKSFRNQSNYIGARVTIGYLYPIKTSSGKLFDLDVKLIVTKRFMKGGGDVSYGSIAGFLSNNTFYGWYNIADLHGLWGNRGVPNGGLLFTELNLGIRKNMPRLRRDIYLGIYGSCSEKFYFKAGEARSDINVTNGHYLNGQLQYYDTDYYMGRDFTLGLKLGIGLKL